MAAAPRTTPDDAGAGPAEATVSVTSAMSEMLATSNRSPLPRASAILATAAGGPARARADALRTVKMLMLFRVGLATLLLVSAVGAKLAEGTPEDLASPFARFGFLLLALTYLCSVGYGLAFGRVRDPVRFAYVQIGGDLLLTTLLVHATGGGGSGFFFLYLIDVVAVALLARRRDAVVVAVASAALMLAVSVLDRLHVLPLVPGQAALTSELEPGRGELATKLALDMAALLAVGFLASALAGRTQKADERLTANEAYAGDLARLHENTIRCLTSGLATLDRAGRVTTANDVACEILGRRGVDIVGLPAAVSMPELPALLDAAGPAGTVRRAEMTVALPDGSVRHLGVSAAPLSDHSGRIIGRVIHFQDLTDLRRMELAVARAERLAGLGRIAAGIAHEIRNPLASISGSIEILRGEAKEEGESRQLMDIAVREVDRLNGLITSLLDYARPPSEERRRVDLGEEVGEIVMAFQRERRDDARPIEVKLERPAAEAVGAGAGAVAGAEPGAEPAPAVEGAGGQLRQVVWNLLRNAAEAMPGGGGAIRVSVARERAGGKEWGVITVADTGTGIPAGDVERIFEPFFSTKSGGTGLGLATVARIIDDHRGIIEVMSEVGRGTTFTVRLPAADRRAPTCLDHAA